MNSTTSSLRKAAILVGSLDDATAEMLLSQMPFDQARAIRAAAAALDELDMLEQDAVIEEFFRIGPMLPEDQPAGIDIERFGERHPAGRKSASEETRREPSGFRRLHHASGASLASRLQVEHPQTIAVVVSHLPADQGADLLASLPALLQGEVARRLVDLEQTDPEILREIEAGLEPWLRQQDITSRRRTVGMQALESILGAADPISHGTLLANLARHDRRLVQQIHAPRDRQLSFAELAELDDSVLSRIFLHAHHETLATALAGAGRALVSRAIRILPVARAARLRRDLDRCDDLHFRDMEVAQQQLADLANEMNRQGQLGDITGRKLSIAI